MPSVISKLEDLPSRLAASLSHPADRPSLQGLSPTLSYGRHSGPPREVARAASVLVLLYRRDGQWHLPLTRRPDHLTQHAGQISLPGGAQESGESSEAAALREAREELGVAPADTRVLGSLSPIYLFNSNFFVTPWVAATDEPLQFRPNAAEVAELIELPISALLLPQHAAKMEIKRGQLRFSAPCILWQGTTVWGATYCVLGQFARILASQLDRGEPGPPRSV